jgi:N,N'-diacetyllegionaminate synthase
MNYINKSNINIIAEIGWNHMGDMGLAEEMITSASKNGADMCKFQTWSVDNLKSGSWDKDGRREIYEKAQLSRENHILLMNICEKNSIQFMTSIFNIDDLEFLIELGLKTIKIPSHEVYNLDLIKATSEEFDTVLVSTGAAKWGEIEKITNYVKSNNLVFMHCVSTYPCPAGKINMPRMEKLKSLSQNIGYSGHFSGIDDGIIAICKGAVYVEKHFTIDQDLPGRDNKFAILPDELKSLCEFRDNYEKMNIDLGLDLQECEKDTFENYRGRWSKDG